VLRRYLCRPAPLVGTALALRCGWPSHGASFPRRVRGMGPAPGERFVAGNSGERLRREVLHNCVNGPRHLSVDAEFVERVEDSDDVPTFSGALVKLFKARHGAMKPAGRARESFEVRWGDQACSRDPCTSPETRNRFRPRRWQQVRRILLCRFGVRRHRSEIMFSVLVIILRPDHVAGLGLSLG
jgi:hypothetical protein